MTPTKKGNYRECKECMFFINNEDKYPCSKSHNTIRKASGQILERHFTSCGLYIRNFKLLKVGSINWAYIFGNIEKVKIISINKKEILINKNTNLFDIEVELTVMTDNGNKRNILANKVFKRKKDLICYLEDNNVGNKLVKDYDLNVCKGIEEERF